MNVRYELKDAVAIVTLDRPDKLNALTVEMREALGTYFEQAARDPAVRAVLTEKDLDEVFRLERYLVHVDAIFARVFGSKPAMARRRGERPR